MIGLGGIYHDYKSVALKVFVFVVQWMCVCACLSFVICPQFRILADCAVYMRSIINHVVVEDFIS